MGFGICYFLTRMGFSFLMLRKMRAAIPVRAVMREIISIVVFEVPAVMGWHPMPKGPEGIMKVR